MDLNLLTIANRASLGAEIQSSIDNTKNRIAEIKVIVDKMVNCGDFSSDEIKKELEFSIIGVVSILEQHLNDMLYHLYVSFPSKLGKNKFELADLQDKGSLLELFYEKATQRILDLAYGRFDNFISTLLGTFDISFSIDSNLLEDVNEIKCTRDCLIHADGKANVLYMQKVGGKARVHKKGDVLKIDYKYFENSVSEILTLINDIEKLIPKKYKESTKAYVFKQMWDATCLSRRVKFENVWKIENPDMISLVVDIDKTFGFSSSEMEVYNLFRYAFGGMRKHKVDFALFFERWEPSSNEYQIALSWLNNQFYF